MEKSGLDQIIDGWRISKTKLFTPTYASAFHAILQSISNGKPASKSDIIKNAGISIESLNSLWEGFVRHGATLNELGEITGMILSSLPSSTIFQVEAHELYAWCALDAIFLPAFIGKEARVRTLSPKNGSEISMSISPNGISNVSPASAVLTLDIPDLNSLSSGAMCSLNHFFPTEDLASQWVGDRKNVGILSPDEAWKVAEKAWIEPFYKALNTKI